MTKADAVSKPIVWPDALEISVSVKKHPTYEEFKDYLGLRDMHMPDFKYNLGEIIWFNSRWGDPKAEPFIIAGMVTGHVWFDKEGWKYWVRETSGTTQYVPIKAVKPKDE